MRVVRILLIVVLILFGLGVGAARYLLGREAVPEKSDYSLDLAEMRRLAGDPAAFPVKVNHEQVAEASLPEGAVFAGKSLTEMHPMTHGAYQVVYSDGTFVLIDSAFDEAMLHVMNPKAAFSSEAWSAIQRALAQASHIAITHEHADHIGGVARFAEPDKLVGRLTLTQEQLASERWMKEAKVPESLLKSVTPLRYDRYHPLAPGVVLVKAPGHTPGSQMVFVRLAGGKELLFLGDVAWHMDQIRELWYRPRLVTQFFLGENREQVLAEFRTLHDLSAREPIVLIASHDVDERKQLIADGTLGEHFQF
jgi:glyoxylase-like metal-dependent hydrolase (beta-lactamase superfamily II)